MVSPGDSDISLLIEDLRYRWVGEYVRTERELLEEESEAWLVPYSDWYPGYLFGGCGVVVDFIYYDDRVWLQSDDGVEWVVDSQTRITAEFNSA